MFDVCELLARRRDLRGTQLLSFSSTSESVFVSLPQYMILPFKNGSICLAHCEIQICSRTQPGQVLLRAESQLLYHYSVRFILLSPVCVCTLINKGSNCVTPAQQLPNSFISFKMSEKKIPYLIFAD